MGPAPSMPLPQTPPPPPNPPMFASQSSGAKQVQRKQQTNQGFGGTILGGISEPASTANKTLLGA